jgi:hypothetical protein
MALLGLCMMHDLESAIGCKRTLIRARRAEQRQRIPPKSIACRRHTLTLLRTARCHAVAPPFRGVYHRARIRATRWLLQVICPSGALSTACRVFFFGFSEIFLFHLPQINSRILAIPPHQRGVSRSSRTRGGVRWTRQRFARNVVAGRVGERPVSDQTAS